jgi:hypothetical protein
MAAGLGFKTFTTGEVLTAADTNGYLMQGILVFASAAARDAAITSPQEGQFAYLKDTNVTTYYTGSAWANVDTTGMTNPMTTTGDIIYSSPGSTPVRLGIGSTGNVLTVASGVPSWSAPASASPASASATVATSQTTTSTSFTDLATAGPAVTITTGTKALVIINVRTESSVAQRSFTSYAVSGATTIAASDDISVLTSLDRGMRISIANRVSTLTAGSNTFTMKYRTESGTGYYSAREIIVIDLGS